ncbi:MAG: M18 family aminopeptidase [Spirochaetaceae bacterium]|nr:M18 family aminopeptidase [Spirochaetaceae bacterium]
MKNDAQKLIDFIDASPSMFHAVENAATYLRQCGFKELREHETFQMEVGGSYFVVKNSSAVIAWKNGTDIHKGFHIVASHVDSPTFKIKPTPAIEVSSRYLKLNTEGYGGAILSSWFDRPLTVAGRIFVETENYLMPKQILVESPEPLLVIPNLAIHMNRDINDGYKYNKQKDTLPLFSVASGDKSLNKNEFMELIAQYAKVSVDSILSYDLYLNDSTPSVFVGPHKEFFLAGKIDNLGMAFASLDTLAHAPNSEHGSMICLFNNEEVGSSTAAGAGSTFFSDTLKRIVFWYANQLGMTNISSSFELFQEVMARSFLISADQAHATHPNYIEKNDITNFPIVNGGPAVKSAASMSYTSEGHTVAVFKKLCKQAGVPCQDFVNRSDSRGGSTIGPITMSNAHIKSVDIGNPILAMHSVKELGGTFDQEAICKVFKLFFN